MQLTSEWLCPGLQMRHNGRGANAIVSCQIVEEQLHIAIPASNGLVSHK